MKSKLILLAGLGSVLALPAFAQVEITITGSTAFRSIVQDRVSSLYDTGDSSYSVTVRDTNIRTYYGHMPSVFPSAPTTPVTVRLSFSGSATGMQSVENGTPVSTVDVGVTNTLVSKVADLALSDVFPSSANPPISDTVFAQHDRVGVVPFVFARNGGLELTGVTNLTRDQAVQLMTASGLMPASFIGGSSASKVYLCGRDSGSGTRITSERCIGFSGTPFLYAFVNGAWTTSTGFTSGGALSSNIATNAGAIGYLGLSDYASVTNQGVTALAYNGIPYTSTNVTTGKYAVWGYEHLLSRVGLSGNQQSVRTQLVNAISDSTYQHNNTLYVGKFEALSDMHVDRAADGAPITSTDF